jgi:hypothetical protein
MIESETHMSKAEANLNIRERGLFAFLDHGILDLSSRRGSQGTEMVPHKFTDS